MTPANQIRVIRFSRRFGSACASRAWMPVSMAFTCVAASAALARSSDASAPTQVSAGTGVPSSDACTRLSGPTMR